MKAGESAEDLLTFTGGYLSNALKEEVQLVRKDDQGSFVKQYSGKELGTLRFEDGDRVIIGTQTSDPQRLCSSKRRGELSWYLRYS